MQRGVGAGLPGATVVLGLLFLLALPLAGRLLFPSPVAHDCAAAGPLVAVRLELPIRENLPDHLECGFGISLYLELNMAKFILYCQGKMHSVYLLREKYFPHT